MLALVMVILKTFFCWFLVVLVVNLIVLVVGIVRVGIDEVNIGIMSIGIMCLLYLEKLRLVFYW